MSEYFVCEENPINDNAINACVNALTNGGLAVFPTETVYGIGADAFNEKAIASLYAKKQRPLDKPLLMHISSLEMAESIAVLNDQAKELIKKYTPGPLTLVVKSKGNLPPISLSGGDTVGLRFPSNKQFLAISKAFGRPIAATSANISGEKSATRSAELKGVLNIADIVIDGGECSLGLESTIISLVNDKPKILRLGSFPKEKILEVFPQCE